MAAQTIATLSGTIQKYFEKSWMDLPTEEFKTPMANSDLLTVATIPKNGGQYAEFRTFSHFTVETNGTDDSPKTYSENAEPSAGLELTGTCHQVALEMLADWTNLGNVQVATDPIDLVSKTKDEFFLLVRRKIHRLTNDRCVKAITANVLNSGLSPSPLPAPFKTVYCGGATFSTLTKDHVYTVLDFKRTVAILRNSNVPGAFGTLYAAIVDSAIIMQLMEDAEFKDVVKRLEQVAQKAFQELGSIDYAGCRFIPQNDEYRCALQAAGGALTTRDDDGAVHVAHVLGKGAMGYVDFGGAKSLSRRTLKPAFKVQDTSKTGTDFTLGWRMPYQACVQNRQRGLNLAGCTRFDDTVDDLPDA